MKINENLIKAIRDYDYLLNKDYPEKGIKKLIGDRYKLSGDERSLLYRGVQKEKDRMSRKNKLASVSEIKNQIIHIDSYNVLITVISYFNGNTVFISTDGLLRDAAEVHGKKIRAENLERSLGLCFQAFKNLKPLQLNFYADQKPGSSAKLADLINLKLSNGKTNGKVIISDSPDNMIVSAKSGIICTSDSEIVDKSNLPVFDLSRFVLDFNFKPKWLDISLTIS